MKCSKTEFAIGVLIAAVWASAFLGGIWAAVVYDNAAWLALSAVALILVM